MPGFQAVWPNHTAILVAVSGGADSLALWDLLTKAGYQVAVWHLDHQLRPESAQEAAFVAARALRLGTRCFLDTVPLRASARANREGLEEAGRRERYARLYQVALTQGFSWVATGHHLDDRIESIVMALLRGGGPNAWRGPRSQRPLGPGVNLIRPLLACHRADLRNWLQQRGETWCEDPSNQNPDFTRNLLRREIRTWEQCVPGFSQELINRAERQLATIRSHQDQAERLLDNDQEWPVAPLLTAAPETALTALAGHGHRLGIPVNRQLLTRLLDLAQGAPGRTLDINGWRWRRRGHSVISLGPPPQSPRR